jgi:anti-sigma regulatory factor (Ser/Thr protein kinase)
VSEFVSLALENNFSSPRLAREIARRFLGSRGLEDDLQSTTALLVGELVTNAVVHGGDEIRLRMECAQGMLRVEVSDTNAALPTVVERGETNDSGRGLFFVSALAEDWGMTPFAGGKVAWFELAV